MVCLKTAQLTSLFVFPSWIVQSFFVFDPKFHAFRFLCDGKAGLCLTCLYTQKTLFSLVTDSFRFQYAISAARIRLTLSVLYVTTNNCVGTVTPSGTAILRDKITKDRNWASPWAQTPPWDSQWGQGPLWGHRGRGQYQHHSHVVG